jgi:aspartate/methionine/tyrosine aminotransferase
MARHFDLYAPGCGVASLRKALAELHRREHGLAVDPERELLVTHGAAGALAVSILVATEPGEELLLPDPCYMLYEPLARSLGRGVSRIPVGAESEFVLSAESLSAAMGPRSRAVLVNSPANPTGAVYSSGQLREITEAAAELGLTLISDEVLDCFSGSSPRCSARGAAEASNVICVNSLSKRFGMTGWRLGWLLAEGEVVEQAVKAQTFLTLGVNHPLQIATAAALGAEESLAELERHATEVRRNGEWLAGSLSALGLPGLWAHRPQGGFYLWVQADSDSPSPGRSPGEELAFRLLEQLAIGVVPGIAFGPAGADHVRISFAGPRSNLEQAVNRISAWV